MVLCKFKIATYTFSDIKRRFQVRNVKTHNKGIHRKENSELKVDGTSERKENYLKANYLLRCSKV